MKAFTGLTVQSTNKIKKNILFNNKKHLKPKQNLSYINYLYTCPDFLSSFTVVKIHIKYKLGKKFNGLFMCINDMHQ